MSAIEEERCKYMPGRSVLLVDMPSYSVQLTSPYRELLERRLKAQTVIHKQRLGFAMNRPGLPYSRGLLLVAAYLEQRGHSVRYLIYPDPGDAQKFVDLCKEADIIGYTAMTPVVQHIYMLCRQAKLLNPSALCVLGGPHANAMGGQCLEECPELDVVITGEGEATFAELVDHLHTYKDVAGIIYRDARRKPVQNSARSSDNLMDIHDMPNPAYHLLSRPLTDYAHNIRTFLGCPYKCNFCIERLSWRGRRGMNSLQRVIEEIRLVSQGAKEKTLIHFSDSIFTLDKERAFELCSLLIREKLNVVFSCDTRVDRIDPDIVKKMAAAQFAMIRLGIEDLDDNVLKIVNKDILTEQSLQAVDVIRSVAPHLVIHAYMLTGLPGSTMGTLARAEQSIPYLIQYDKVDVIGNKILVPYPGTPYFEAPERYHMQILHRRWSEFDRLSFPVYRNKDLTEYQIYFGFLTLESVLLRAYETKIADSNYINQAPPESLDYVYRCYVQKSDPQNLAEALLVGAQSPM